MLIRSGLSCFCGPFTPRKSGFLLVFVPCELPALSLSAMQLDGGRHVATLRLLQSTNDPTVVAARPLCGSCRKWVVQDSQRAPSVLQQPKLYRPRAVWTVHTTRQLLK